MPKESRFQSVFSSQLLAKLEYAAALEGKDLTEEELSRLVDEGIDLVIAKLGEARLAQVTDISTRKKSCT